MHHCGLHHTIIILRPLANACCGEFAAALAIGVAAQIVLLACSPPFVNHTPARSLPLVARLLRAATGIKGLDPHAARAQVYAQVRDADPEDLALFDDLVGIADPDVKLPKIDPDARRRRLTALVNAVSVDITVRSATSTR